MTTPPVSGSPTGQSDPAAGEPPAKLVVRRTRIGSLWVASALFALILLLLLIFILENGQKARISYFGAHGQLPLGVALLLAAVLGVLLVVIPGGARILQLRMLARRHRRSDARAAAPAAQPAEVAQPAPGSPQATGPGGQPLVAPPAGPPPVGGGADAGQVQR
jgi:uncharacterized integral membrane protein